MIDQICQTGLFQCVGIYSEHNLYAYSPFKTLPSKLQQQQNGRNCLRCRKRKEVKRKMQIVHFYSTLLFREEGRVTECPLIGGDIKRCFCLTSDDCLSRTSGLTREQRGLGRPKLAKRWPTSHVTRTLLSRSKGQGHQAALLTALLAR